MYRTRATLLTIKSLIDLSKVCYPRHSLDSFKTLAFVKNLSTVTERSDYQNPNGFDGENCIEHQQNRRGFYSNNQNNPVGVEQNPSGVYGQSYRSEFQQNFVGQSGHKSNYAESPRNEFQQNPVGKNVNFNGYYGENSGELGRNPSGFNTESLEALQQKSSSGIFGESMNVQNPYGFKREGAVEVQQNPNGLESWVGVNGSCGDSNVQFRQSSSDHYIGNNGTSHKNPSQSNMGNNTISHQSSYDYYTGNTQHVMGNCYNTGAYQQNQSGYHGEHVGNPNGYMGEKIADYRQNPSRNLFFGSEQNPSGIYHANGGPNQQISNESENAVEAAESSQLRGTIEEFDRFLKEGILNEALEVLGLLEQQRIPVDMPRYLALMKACGEAEALQEAKFVHEHLIRSVCSLEVSTYNIILEMYSKCGSMDDAFMVFHKMPQRNLTSWDTMITWLAKNGSGEDAIELFTQFKGSGLKPDGEIFLGIFFACSVLGDIDEGLLHFESMSKNYGIVPSMGHYVGVVEMFGSTGYLDEALEFIEKMPMEPSVDVWETLMNLCRVQGNMELGDRCAELVELLDPSRLSEESKAGIIPVKASDLAKEKRKKKLAGQNLLDARSRVHEYRAGDRSHPDNDKIYALLRGMKEQMKEAGYVPETKFVLHDIDQEGKEEALLAHSERLAVAQGLMSSPARSQMRIIKNLRVCGDCHNALKIISKLVGRPLIIRDAKRFHHFEDGVCSCKDYW